LAVAPQLQAKLEAAILRLQGLDPSGEDVNEKGGFPVEAWRT
jgi:hypothetical protein